MTKRKAIGRRLVAGIVLVLATSGGAAAIEEPNWKRDARSTGTVFHICRTNACSLGSMVSCHIKAPHAVRDLAAFEAAERRMVEQLKKLGANIEQKPATATPMGETVLYRSERTVRTEKAPTEFYVQGLLAGPTFSLSLVSSSPDAEAAARNFAEMVAGALRDQGEARRKLCDPQFGQGDARPGNI